MKSRYDELRSKKSINTSLGHVKRKLMQNEPLKGKILEAALYAVDKATGSSTRADDIHYTIRNKLINGIELNDYESHLMIDVILVQAKYG